MFGVVCPIFANMKKLNENQYLGGKMKEIKPKILVSRRRYKDKVYEYKYCALSVFIYIPRYICDAVEKYTVEKLDDGTILLKPVYRNTESRLESGLAEDGEATEEV